MKESAAHLGQVPCLHMGMMTALFFWPGSVSLVSAPVGRELVEHEFSFTRQ